jgi:hypothetical protein
MKVGLEIQRRKSKIRIVWIDMVIQSYTDIKDSMNAKDREL